MSLIAKLLVMILLGLVSAALSYYRKNIYVRTFDDILGRDEEEKTEARIGRGFWYGFFFPIYFVLLLSGLVALISFLLAAGIIAAIVFVISWITEKILPHDWIGQKVLTLLIGLGFRGPVEPVQPQSGSTGSNPSFSCCSCSTPAAGGSESDKKA